MTTPANPDDLITWLRAQLDDDEQLASALTLDDDGCWSMERVGRVIDEHGREVAECTELGRVESQHIARHDPDRVLRRVAADRRILDEAERVEAKAREALNGENSGLALVLQGERLAMERTVRMMARSIANRPGYREAGGEP